MEKSGPIQQGSSDGLQGLFGCSWAAGALGILNFKMTISFVNGILNAPPKVLSSQGESRKARYGVGLRPFHYPTVKGEVVFNALSKTSQNVPIIS